MLELRVDMQDLVSKIESKYKKPQVVDVHSGDIVRVHQKIQEGDKTRTQVFEGMVIRTDRKNSLTSRITVRRIASGVGVEKSFLMHSPLVQKVEVTKRSKVRRNNLSYMRGRAGKSARLVGTKFDKETVNTIEEQMAEAEVVPGEPDSKDAKVTEEVNQAEAKSEETSQETPVEAVSKDQAEDKPKAKAAKPKSAKAKAANPDK